MKKIILNEFEDKNSAEKALSNLNQIPNQITAEIKQKEGKYLIILQGKEWIEHAEMDCGDSRTIQNLQLDYHED